MSKQKNKQNVLSSLNGSTSLRALIATFFTVFLMFGSAVVAYTWGYVHGINASSGSSNTSSSSSSRSGSALAVSVSEPKVADAVLYERSGTVIGIAGETLTFATAGKKTLTARLNADTEYFISAVDASGETSSQAAQAADIRIGDVIRVFAGTNIASVSTFIATRIEKSS
ncbi:MAG: hypothetical protein A3F54_00605 [Candidatus Kerfeldbacteria bacterium RIFCSPHIGHO2_12_FULL_48_17]|uniref:Uncharacterized protein n=1 Tax=Candidatus Kerfeldbacteria bacterium RIFCSPHIGHO2_12_FULL_48_17 TaxID=1798542 RepID=A0A1G2B5E7_9BACT|nr:MAG: hypothetical protein A3F54_00605 [Candidatus Kerfeldbacteria bacterium RIFCSPHIGHO2_12_FULL_48_17]